MPTSKFKNQLPAFLEITEINLVCLDLFTFSHIGFGLLVKWLSDPDNLNQLVLSQLDSASPKGSVDDLCGSDPEQSSLGSEGKDDGEMGEV